MNVGGRVLTFAEPRATCGAITNSATIISIRTRRARENFWKRDQYRSSESGSSFENRQLATQDGHNATKESVKLSAKRLEYGSWILFTTLWTRRGGTHAYSIENYAQNSSHLQ